MLNFYDVYVSGGSNDLYTCWTDKVTKYDGSSFYNWEQDNLPLHDLEERTHLLWERLGFPTSAITGMSFVVSADLPSSSCNPIYFQTLSACLNALPEVINFPILVEVASFGDLGELNLSNKIFGARGSLEIVNRNYGVGHPQVGAMITCSQKLYAGAAYPYASGLDIGGFPENILTTQGNPAPILSHDHVYSKIYSTGQYIAGGSFDSDVRFRTGATVFSRKVQGGHNARLTAALADNNVTPYFSSITNSNEGVKFDPYELNAESEDLINTYDASCINYLTGDEIIWDNFGDINYNNNASSLEAAAMSYLNKLSKISVKNCDGPIYIRYFTVDGGVWSGTNVGIDIENSDVVLEGMSVSRCKRAGLRAVNSNVTLGRGFVAYRNYPFDASGNRLGSPWLSKINSYTPQEVYGAGILLENSNLFFDKEQYDTDVERFRLLGGSEYANYGNSFAIIPAPIKDFTVDVPVPTYSWLYCLSKNDIGIHAINSKIYGGKTEVEGVSDVDWYDANQIFLEHNTEAGIKLENSVLENSGRLLLFGNYVGLDATNSKLFIDSLKAEYNQKEGVKLRNSTLNYNKDLYDLYVNSNLGIALAFRMYQVSLLNNGVHLSLDNSVMAPVETSGMPDIYSRFIASGSFGVTQDETTQRSKLPSIIVENNSKLEMIHPGIETPEEFLEINKPVYGAAVAVKDNSELVLRGTKTYISKIIGPDSATFQSNKAGLFADNGSVIKVQGPTVIAKYGIDALADNNSKIEITPIRDNNGSLLVSAYSLDDPDNHTVVELHSTRACLVADHGSVIKLEDCGDYSVQWQNGAYGSEVLLSGLDYLTDASKLNTAYYTSAGSVQFYPNPNDTAQYPPGVQTPAINLDSAYTIQDNNGFRYFFNADIGDPLAAADFSGITTGGMCVRALNQSKVDVDNVHFPCGWWNPSGIIYDISGAGLELTQCTRLFIWNIADNSQLNANYVSVSGVHPRDAEYYGPSGTWGAASAAPESTPDTGTVSILDYYGRATNHSFGKDEALNHGPFRLYFSVDPAVNWMLTNTLELSGYIPQVYAQGYQFSGNCVMPSDFSSYYTSVWQDNGGVAPSGFYYASAMVASPNTIKAILDDSASNAFANAKHNSVGKSGLSKTVQIYMPFTSDYGGDSAQSSAKEYGKGVRSVNTFDLEKDN